MSRRVYIRVFSTSAAPSRSGWDEGQPRICARCGEKVTLKQHVWMRRFPAPETIHMSCLR